MKKISLIILFIFSLAFQANAGDSGDQSLSAKENGIVKDCFENINRGVFAFNKALDNILFEPIAKGYRILPSPIRSGASNALGNLTNVVTIPNNILQGEIKKAGNNTARFAINTTIGILGLFDPASKLGFEKLDKEDYGQTLATWGVGEGCYIVLPVLGPSTARDTFASLATFMGGDAWYNVTVRNDTQYFSEVDYYSSRLTSGIDFRAKNFDSIENLEKNSLDFYASVKSLYLQDRQQKILNFNKTVNTQDDSDWEEIQN